MPTIRRGRSVACIPQGAIYYRGMPCGKSRALRGFRTRSRAVSVRRHNCLAALGVLFAGASCLVIGCHAPAQPTGPTEIVLRVPDYDAFMDASLSVLRFHEFPPDRVDRARGLIVSEPTTSAQWFEWWRADAPGGYQLLESSLHTIRRVVTVHVEPVDASTAEAGERAAAPTSTPAVASSEPLPAETRGAGRYRIDVQVEKSRYSAPERQITTASGALQIYSQATPTTEGERGPRSVKVQWVPLGRDPLLEAFLLAKLADALPNLRTAD